MKKIIAMLLALAMLLCLTACGGKDVPEETVSAEPTPATVGENGLTPREQFEQTQQAMAELNGETQSDDADTDTAAAETDTADDDEGTAPATGAEPVTYTTNGLTYTLDSTFTSGNEAADNFQHKYTSDTMWITEQMQGNTFNLFTSQELAEAIAAQKDTCIVDSANGVYFVEDTATGTIKAYYVDDSGYYWILSGFVTGGNDYNTYRSQLIEFCTSGQIA